MPKRKSLPEIPELIVQKTNPLLSLSETDLSLVEFKLLDAYLGRIDSHKPETRLVTMEKGQIEEYLGVTQIKTPDLEKRIDNLFQTVTIRDPDKPNGFTKIALFEKAECLQDEDGIWIISLCASAGAMEYIFTPENIGYLKYRLSNVVNLTSRYSYVLFLYLENYRYRSSWIVPVDELKKILRCNADSYKNYWRFNDLVLKKCHKELTEKTSFHFEYEPVKRGRTVVAVRFTMEPVLSPNAPDNFFIEPPSLDEQIEFLRSACTPEGSDEPEFSRIEMEQLFQVLVMIEDERIMPRMDSIEFSRYHYLAYKYSAMNRMASKNKIKNRFAYFLQILKNDAGIT